MDKISKFNGEFDFLSNFYISPFILDGYEWRTAEHYYQAMKSENMDMQDRIRRIYQPGNAKIFGRQIKLRPNWEDIKEIIMLSALKAKFAQNDYIRRLLLNTGKAELIEGNYWHDNFWGDCNCPKCSNIKGENNLGKMLMRIRRKYFNEERKSHG